MNRFCSDPSQSQRLCPSIALPLDSWITLPAAGLRLLLPRAQPFMPSTGGCRSPYNLADDRRDWCQQAACVFLVASCLHRFAQEMFASPSLFPGRGKVAARNFESDGHVILADKPKIGALIYLRFVPLCLAPTSWRPVFHRPRRTFDHSSPPIHQTTGVLSSLVFIYRTSSSCTRGPCLDSLFSGLFVLSGKKKFQIEKHILPHSNVLRY